MGRSYYKNVDVKYGIAVDSLGTNLGLRDGDKIVSVGGVAMDKFSAGFAVKQIVLNNANVIKVQRNGQEIDLQVPAELAGKLTTKEYKNKEIYSIRYPQKIESVKEKSLGRRPGSRKEMWSFQLTTIPMLFLPMNLLRKSEGIKMKP